MRRRTPGASARQSPIAALPVRSAGTSAAGWAETFVGTIASRAITSSGLVPMSALPRLRLKLHWQYSCCASAVRVHARRAGGRTAVQEHCQQIAVLLTVARQGDA